ncbi:MAG: OstA-like protein [bacterium]
MEHWFRTYRQCRNRMGRAIGSHRVISLAIVVLCLITPLLAQEGRIIELKSADLYHVKVVKDQEVRVLIGNVHFIQRAPEETIEAWCDTAFQYMDENRMELFGKVKIIRDSVVLYAPEGEYFGNDRRAEMKKHVRLEKGKITLTAAYGEYYVREKRAHFSGNIHVVDSTSSTDCNDLVFFEEEEKSIAVRNVKVYSPENNLTILGDSLVHFSQRQYSLMLKNPLMIQIDTSSAGVLDTLLVSGKVMEAYRDSTQRFIVRDSVEMIRSDFASRAGFVVYYLKDDHIALRNSPILWQGESQVTGDSIDIILKKRRLEKVTIRGRSMALSQSDSIQVQRYDQLTAREMTMYFERNKLQRIEADRTATSLYYVYEKGESNGANRSSGDRIIIEFNDGKSESIRIIKGVEGRYLPESQIANHERDYQLDGFRLIPNRPRRVKLQIVH